MQVVLVSLLAGLLHALVPGTIVASSLDPSPPFVICEDQKYALCASASCFVYNGVAYCKCNILKGDSISLSLEFSTGGESEDVCDVNEQGKKGGYMVSTFSLPSEILKGGPAAIYTCPGVNNAGDGVVAPVAYGQCDGGLCFTSTKGKTFPGFEDKLASDEIICSCPISTAATPGSVDPLGYQIIGAYRPQAPRGSRCEPSACAACSVRPPITNGTVSNGSTIPVGSPTGTGRFLGLRLNGPPAPETNECLCTCAEDTATGATLCTVAADLTPVASGDLADLTVRVAVVNTPENGGTATPDAFTLRVTSSTGNTNVGGVKNGQTLTLPAGSYVASKERGPSYTALLDDCRVTLASGQGRTCIATFEDAPFRLSVGLKVTGDARPSDFVVNVTAAGPRPQVFPGSETPTTVQMKPGSYSLAVQPVRDVGRFTVKASSGCSGLAETGISKDCTLTAEVSGQ